VCFATMAAVAGVVGAATTATSTIAGGIANQNSAAYQATVAQNNSVIVQQNATRAEQAGAAAAENQGRKGATQSAALKVAQASGGVDVNTGSVVDVQAGERETNLLDTETVMQNADLKAYGYRVQGENFQSEAALDTAKSEEAVPAAALKAGGGLLSSASALGPKFANFNWSGGAPSGPQVDSSGNDV
jgi:hypothetical protein